MRKTQRKFPFWCHCKSIKPYWQTSISRNRWYISVLHIAHRLFLSLFFFFTCLSPILYACTWRNLLCRAYINDPHWYWWLSVSIEDVMLINLTQAWYQAREKYCTKVQAHTRSLKHSCALPNTLPGNNLLKVIIYSLSQELHPSLPSTLCTPAGTEPTCSVCQIGGT